MSIPMNTESKNWINYSAYKLELTCLLTNLQSLMNDGVAYFPKFDHSIGDPEFNAIQINKVDFDIIIIEGI